MPSFIRRNVKRLNWTEIPSNFTIATKDVEAVFEDAAAVRKSCLVQGRCLVYAVCLDAILISFRSKISYKDSLVLVVSYGKSSTNVVLDLRDQNTYHALFFFAIYIFHDLEKTEVKICAMKMRKRVKLIAYLDEPCLGHRCFSRFPTWHYLVLVIEAEEKAFRSCEKPDLWFLDLHLDSGNASWVHPLVECLQLCYLCLLQEAKNLIRGSIGLDYVVLYCYLHFTPRFSFE